MTLQTATNLKADAAEFLVDMRKLSPRMQGVICGMTLREYLISLDNSEISTTNESRNRIRPKN